MNNLGWTAMIFWIIVIGLLLKFGKDTTGIIGSLSSGFNSGLDKLTLSNNKGNP